jgi:hypothetical protein
MKGNMDCKDNCRLDGNLSFKGVETGEMGGLPP